MVAHCSWTFYEHFLKDKSLFYIVIGQSYKAKQFPWHSPPIKSTEPIKISPALLAMSFLAEKKIQSNMQSQRIYNI